jgi:AcrB/AcrD/AcrF family
MAGDGPRSALEQHHALGPRRAHHRACGGLRASEVTSLKVADIDSSRMVIRIEQGKGVRDGYVVLSPRLLDILVPTGAWRGQRIGYSPATTASIRFTPPLERRLPLGLMPILWSTGTGSELMRGITVPMIAGIFSWTVLTLIVIPAVYGLVKGWRLRRMVAAPVAAASDHHPFGSRPAE